MRNVRGRRGWLAAGLLVAMLAGRAAAEGDEATRRWSDSGRLYLDFMGGQSWLMNDRVAPGVTLDAPNGGNALIGGSLGYVLSEHWSLELQAQFTEMDLRSDTLGKLAEYANLTAMPAARFRWPIGDGRWLPWASAGLGIGVFEVNDTANAAVKVDVDNTTTLVGMLAAGVDYFAADDVLLGFGVHSYLYPDQDTEVRYRDARGRVTQSGGSLNYTSVALLGHIRILLGQAPVPGETRPRRLLLADHGPFDTAERRAYLVGLFGVQRLVDDDYGGGVKVTDDHLDANVGGALGMNFDAHWGAEVQMQVCDRSLEGGASGSKLAELSTFTIVPAVRFRYPFLDGRLVPFWTGGVGFGFVQPNDHLPYFEGSHPPVRTPSVDAGGPAVVGMVGVGVEYFLNHHVSVGFAVPVQFGPGVETTIRYPGAAPVHGHFAGTSVGATIRLAAYMP